MKRKLKNTRPKALAGAAIPLISAGVGLLGNIFSSKSSSDAAIEAAKINAEAIADQTKNQVESMKQQIDNQNQLQKDSIEFTRGENERMRQLQNNVQMSLQLIAGKENNNEARKEALIRFKSGGRKRLKRTYPLRGSTPFSVTDGGGAIPLGQTDLGNLVYELYGNDHEHYHKAQGGKNKTGVGVKFADGNVVEGEGNQGSSRGELLMIDPAGTDARFISKHSIPNTGFNPRLAVEEGMSPEEAFQIQEYLKTAQGLNSDGKKMHPRRRNNTKALLGYANSILANGLLAPDYSVIPISDAATGIAGGVALQQDNINKIMKHGGRYRLKKGGRCKAIYGDYTPLWATNMPGVQYGYYDNLPQLGAQSTQGAIKPLAIAPMTVDTSKAPSTIITPQAPKLGTYLGATGISALGGVLGNLITGWGNNTASGLLADAYRNASKTLYDAYSKMHGIDMSAIRREDYNPAHALAAVRTARVNVNPQLEDIARQEREAIKQTNNSTMSSAAKLNRIGAIQSASNQERSKVYGTQSNEEEKIAQANNQAINYMANENANRDTEANERFAGDYLDLLRYNNDIANGRLAKMAEAQAMGILEPAKIHSQNRATNYGMWGNTLAGIGNGFGNALFTYQTDTNDFNNTMLGAPLTNQLLAMIPNMDQNELDDVINRYSGYNFGNAAIIVNAAKAEKKRR